MVDWTQSMQQTFEYYIIDPITWKEKSPITTVKSSTIDRDSTTDTLESASIDTTESLDECYVRIYLVTIQNGIKEKHPLGTFIVQSPSISFNGKSQSITLDAYSPLLEVKEKQPPIGYSLLKGANIMENAYRIIRESTRTPVVQPICSTNLENDFVSNLDDTWIGFVKDLIANAKYELRLDELSRVLFSPKQDTAALKPMWTFNDDNSSILLPEISVDRDLYGIPNVVEIVYSGGRNYFYSKVINNDPNSPVSTVNRGREIIYRETNPSLGTMPSQTQIDIYAKEILKSLSSLEYTVSYTHGYCPVRLGDCVMLNYRSAGISNVKAKIISQSIKCGTGCQVTEKAVFTNSLWG